MHLTVLALGLALLASLTIPKSEIIVGAQSHIDPLKLIIECRQLADEGIKQNKYLWLSGEPLPELIKSLSPQFVRLQVTESPREVVINIQCSGGFQHAGLLVVCDGDDPNFVPQIGRDWKISKLAEKVFEYRE
jgi:hypothetical protein